MRAFREQWRSFELILGTDRIQQERYDYDLTLLRSEDPGAPIGMDANNTSAGVLASGPWVGDNWHPVPTAGHVAHPLCFVVSDCHSGLLRLDFA